MNRRQRFGDADPNGGPAAAAGVGPAAPAGLAGTDGVGAAAYNQELSEQPARAVGEALAGFGVPVPRLRPQARGERKPVRPDAEGRGGGRRLNCRVELVLRDGG